MKRLIILTVIAVLTLVPGIGMAQTTWEKYPANPVLNLGDDGSWDEVHVSHPCVLFDGSTYHLWYVGDNGSLRGIGYARSNNGVVWEKYPGNPVLTDGLGDVWDGDFVSQPYVLHDGTQYCMWYSGYDGSNLRIGYATSDDGIVWNKHAANPVLDLGDGGLWDAMGVSNPTVMYDGTQYRMWYAGHDDSNLRIGYATSSDGVTWSKDTANPILDLGLIGSWDAVGVSSPTVVYDGTQYQMCYTGYDGSSLRVGYATSTDGMVWNKDTENPVLDLGASGLWDAVGVSGPTTVVLGTEDFRMWYTGYDGTNMRIGLSYLGCPDAGSGEPLASLTTHAHANPAIYEATSENGAEVTIDGSQSIGSDGEPIADPSAYEWDLNNDGDFSDATGVSVTHVYPIGEHTAALRVTDSGESNVDTVNIKVEDTSPPIVKLLTPHGGEVYQGGGAVTIRWELATDVVSLQNNAIALYYNSDGGDWQLIAQDEANDGQYDWTAPVVDSDNVKIKIEATDSAGNIGSDISSEGFIIDSQSPVVELITPNGSEVLAGGSFFQITWQPATDNLGLTDAPISLSYSADDGANWELIATGEGNDGQFDWNIPALDSENALVRVETVDRAGNVGADISDEVFVIDSSQPEPPALTQIDSPTLENVLIIEGTTEALSQVSLFNDGNLMGGMQAGDDGNFSFTTPTLSDGTHSFTATAIDVAGNISDASTAVDVLVDTVTPKRPIPLSPADGIVLNASPTLVWEVVSDATAVSYRVKVDDEQNFASPEVDVSDIAETQFSPTLPDGLWFWRVQAIDVVGHEGELSPIFQFSLDTVAPDVPIITSPEAGAIVSETGLAILGTAEPESHVSISPLGSVVADTAGRFALVVDSLAEEEHTLTTIATDAAGNESDVSQHSFSVDNTAPTVLLTYPNGGELFRGGDSIDITWEPAIDGNIADNPISLFYSLAGFNGWIPIAQNLPDDGIYSWNIPQVNSQSVRVKVNAVDLAGNIGEDASDTDFTIDSEVPMSQLTIIAPSKEQTEYLRGGSVYTILWSLPQDNFSLSDVSLSYSDDGGNNWSSIAQVMDVGPTYGSYDWDVPAIDSQQVVIRIEAIDASGNEAEDVSGNHLIDSTVPVSPVINPIDSPTTQNIVNITGTAEATAGGDAPLTQVNLFCDGGLIANVEADVNGIFSFTTESLSDGLHSLTATTTDVAGNESAISAPVEVVVDTVPTDRPILSSPTNGIAVNISPTLVWEAVSDVTAVTYHVQVDDEPGFASPEVDMSDITETQLVLTLPDGVWFWRVRANDAVGNVSDFSVALKFTLDTLAPDAPVIVSPKTGTISRETSLMISGTVGPKSRVDIYDSEEMLGADITDADGKFALAVEELAEGEHTFTAKATDNAGNMSDASNPVTLIVDITVPAPPVVLSPNAGIVTNENELTIEGTAEVGSTVTLLDNEAILGVAPTDVDGSFSYTTRALADGIHSFTATATDVAGNVSDSSESVTVTVDATYPAPPVVLSPNAGIVTNENELTIEGTAEVGSTVTLVDNEAILGVVPTDVDGSFSLSTHPLSDGIHSFTAIATDVAGNVSDSSEATTVTVDTDESAPPTFSSPADGSITNQNILTLEGTAEAGSTVTLVDNEAILGVAPTDVDGSFSYTTRALADGIHSFTATAVDLAGNVSDSSESITVTVDTTAPVVSVSLDKQEYTTNDGVIIDYTATDNLDDSLSVTITTTPELTVVDNQIQPPLPANSLTVTITATDDADNSTTASASAVVKALVARLDVIPNLFEIKIPKKPKKPEQPDNSVLLTAYLSFPEGISPTEINTSSLRLNESPPNNTSDHDLVLEAQFEVDETFIASLLSLDVALIDKLEQNANDIRVFLNEPVQMASITLGKLEITGVLNNQATFASEDASRQITLKESAAPAVTRTFLAQNYPNPFNPDTWIPYALAWDADVTIKIFDVRGNLVRCLRIGYQEAGFYMERSEAAYWDGKDSFGQRAASGLYFYTLQSGEFKDTRRMVIMK